MLTAIGLPAIGVCCRYKCMATNLAGRCDLGSGIENTVFVNSVVVCASITYRGNGIYPHYYCAINATPCTGFTSNATQCSVIDAGAVLNLVLHAACLAANRRTSDNALPWPANFAAASTG